MKQGVLRAAGWRMALVAIWFFPLAVFGQGNPAPLESPAPYYPPFDLGEGGLVPRPTDESKLPPSGGMGTMDVPPSSWDWRAHSGVTSVKDQNPYGACWSFAGTGGLESRVLINSSTIYDFSEYNLISCNVFGTNCNSGGNDYYVAVHHTQKGAALESCDAYSQCPTAACHPACPAQVTVLGWAYLANNVAEIKDAVYHLGPVYASIYASDPNFQNLAPGAVYYYTGTNPTDHAVLIVGYDDNKVHAGGAGAWLIKNSWGTWWSSSGYGWVAYGSARIGENASVYTDYQPANPSESLVYYDERGCDYALGYPSGVDWGMIRVNPPQSGALSRVDFWTTYVNASYRIRVYDNFSGSALSTLIASQDGSVAKKGYYSIPLATPPAVTAGNEIFVAVEFTTPGYSYPIPMDYWGATVPNKSYISDTGAAFSPHARDVAIRARIVPVDTDGDGLSDPQEIILGTNPNNPDTDGDGVSDGAEYSTYHTNPLDWDSDHDALPDGYEISQLAASPPLDPLSASDAAQNFDGDANSNLHEYWNDSDPWTTNPVGAAGCFFWADAGSGDGIVSPTDAIELKKAISGGVGNYSGVVPNTGETHELDMDGYISPLDLIILQKMIQAAAIGPLGSRPNALVTTDAPGATVAVGFTTHVTVSVRNEAAKGTPGFGVIFEIVPASSTATATLLGGEGNGGGSSRYDISGPITPGGLSRIVLRLDSVGTLTLRASIPLCGSPGIGRSCNEIILSPAAVIRAR